MNTNSDRQNVGWVSTLVALVVLVVVGFLGGALAGFLWEEPKLVLAYLSGKTEPVEFSEPASVAAEPPGYSESAELGPDAHAKLAAQEAPLAERAPSTPAVAAPPRDEPLEVAPEVAPAPAAPKAAEKPAEKKPVIAPAKPAPAVAAPAKVALATPAGRFSVQVGAFADRASADKLVSRLRGRGYSSYVKADSEGGAKRFRVRVGPVNVRERAEELAAKLAKGEKLPTWVLDESKG
jgi:cell division septation protein DedD